MKTSEKIRTNRNQHIVKNNESKKQDNDIKKVISVLLFLLKRKYPHLKFGLDKKIMIQTIEKMVNSDIYRTSDKSFITPDGGFLYVLINGQKKYILVSEQKRQGTNDKRITEGKSKQSQGNAVERLGKNVDALDVMFGDEDIYPFVVFLQGCDFYDVESTIGDRIRTIAKFQETNKINLHWRQLQKHNFIGGSYFMRGHSMLDKPGSSDWSKKEMFDVMYEIATKSVEYYLEK